MYRILMIDDEPWFLLSRKAFLEEKGCQIQTARTTDEALEQIASNSFDLILLDVKMPDICGFDLCEEIHKDTDTPIVFFSNLSDEREQLLGFAAGGVDYIPKDCPQELLWAKMKARFPSQQGEMQRCFPPLSLDLQRQRASIDGVEITLTPFEFSLLALLSSRPGFVWTVEELYRTLWGTDGPVSAQIVQGHLSRMRRKISTACPRHEFVETVWGKGYVFVPAEESYDQ